MEIFELLVLIFEVAENPVGCLGVVLGLAIAFAVVWLLKSSGAIS